MYYCQRQESIMKILLSFYLLFAVSTLGSSFILIPEEVTSLLSLLYSRLPIISAGINNTKLGLGFRLGRNVDLQVLFELGPQNPNASTTRPTESSKREITSNNNRLQDGQAHRTNSTLINRLWGRRPSISTSTTMDVRLMGDDKENEIESR